MPPGKNYALHLKIFQGAKTLNLSDVLRDGGINIRDNYQRTPLYMAARLGCVQIISCLLEAGCDIDMKGPKGNSALHAAVKLNHISAVAVLLDAGANRLCKNDFSQTPLELTKNAKIEEMFAGLCLSHALSELVFQHRISA